MLVRNVSPTAAKFKLNFCPRALPSPQNLPGSSTSRPNKARGGPGRPPSLPSGSSFTHLWLSGRRADAAVGEYVPGRGIGYAALCGRIGAAATPRTSIQHSSKQLLSSVTSPSLNTQVQAPPPARKAGGWEVGGRGSNDRKEKRGKRRRNGLRLRTLTTAAGSCQAETNTSSLPSVWNKD